MSYMPITTTTVCGYTEDRGKSRWTTWTRWTERTGKGKNLEHRLSIERRNRKLSTNKYLFDFGKWSEGWLYWWKGWGMGVKFQIRLDLRAVAQPFFYKCKLNL